MYLYKKGLFILGLLVGSALAMAQPDSCRFRISLLTCGPGDDLYSIWGHTGIRVIDTAQQTDVVFNYGTFDDSDPLFYIKFTRGIMMYSVAPYSFPDFMEEYKYYKRSVTEQVLDLHCAEKLKLVKALWINTETANKFYPYHFYADNCTTRARDIISNHTDTAIAFQNIRPLPTSTYRQLIHSYMNNNSQAWNRLAIDVLLGNHLDEIMTNKQAMFLPDYLLKGFDSAALRQDPLVSETNILLPDEREKITSFFTPVAVFSIILVTMLALWLLKNNTADKALNVLDGFFFLVTGFFGLLMLVLWLARVDSVCRNNYNLLWALPTHLIIAFVISKQKKWIKYYWLLTAVINVLLLITWKWLPQEMNNSLLLVVTILLFRSIVRYRKINTA
ncbi:MAG: DUF4105 domain-containing protein [Chitinophagaceae bacterium]